MSEIEKRAVDRRTRVQSHLTAYATKSRPVWDFKNGTTKFLFSVGYNFHADKITEPSRTDKATLAGAREVLLRQLSPVLEKVSSPEYESVREELTDAIAALDPYLPSEDADGDASQEVVRLDSVGNERRALENIYKRIHEQSEKVTALVTREINGKEIAKVWQEGELDQYTKMALQVRIEAGGEAGGTVEEIEAAVQGMTSIDERLKHSNGEPILVKYGRDRRVSRTDGLGLMIKEDDANPPARVLSLGPRAVNEYTDLHTPGYPVISEGVEELTLPYGALRLLTRDRVRDILIGEQAIRDHLERNPSDQEHIAALFAVLDSKTKAIEGNSREKEITQQ